MSTRWSCSRRCGLCLEVAQQARQRHLVAVVILSVAAGLRHQLHDQRYNAACTQGTGAGRRQCHMSCVVITEEADTRTITEHATRAQAEAAMRRYVAYLATHGATVTGDVNHGYTAAWQEEGRHMLMRITLGQVQ